MDKLLVIRRRNLGRSSAKAFSQLLEQEGIQSVVWRNDRSFQRALRRLGSGDYAVLRWGCTASTPLHTTTGYSASGLSLNKSTGIHTVNNKVGFLQTLTRLENQTGLLPLVVLGGTSSTQTETFATVQSQQWVVRPATHSQGRNLRVLTTGQMLSVGQSMTFNGYARPLVNKSAEYRVFVVNGKAVNVVKKTPSNSSAVAWNVAQGGRFDNVRWGDWPINVVDLACRIAPHTGLNITGIDIMVDHDDNAWFIEANSAPTLPYNSDGSFTYRQKCVAKALAYTLKENSEMFPYQQGETWRDYVHPAIQ